MSAPNWVIVNAGRGGRLECLRCGEHYQPQLPAPINLLAALGEAFEKDHRKCKLSAEGLHCVHCGENGHPYDECPTLKVSTPEQWWNGTDTGLSSMTLWCVMMGAPFSRMRNWKPAYPMDPADFGRCHRLLKLFPAWRERIGEMVNVSGWRRLVLAWDELEKLYEEELPSGGAPKLYERMKELGA